MNKLQDWLGKTPARFALLLYLSVGLVQMAIIPAGLEAWLGIHWMFGVMCAGILTWIPLVGQAAGIAAAYEALDWRLAAAAAVLFSWPVWFLGTAFIVRQVRRGREAAARDAELFGKRFGTAGADRDQGGEFPPHSGTDHPIQSAA